MARRHIEFIGLPGSGKTTLSNSLVKMLRGKGETLFFLPADITALIRRRDDGLIKNALKQLPSFVWNRFLGIQHALPEVQLFVAEHVELLNRMLSVFDGKSVSSDFRESLIYSSLLNFAEYQLAKKLLNEGEILILEEGLCHRGYSFYGQWDDELFNGLEDYVNLIPLPSDVVWAKCSVDNCLRRLRKRDRMPLRYIGLSDEACRRRLSCGLRSLDCIAELLRRRGVSVRTVETDADGPAALSEMNTLAQSL